MVPVASTAVQMRSVIESDRKVIEPLVKQLGIRMEKRGSHHGRTMVHKRSNPVQSPLFGSSCRSQTALPNSPDKKR